MTKENEHFKRAKKIIKSWPKWKQQIGSRPKSNINNRRNHETS